MFMVWCGRLEVGGVPSHLASRGTGAAKYPSHQSNPPIRGSPMHWGLFPYPRRKTVSGMDKQDWKNGIGGCCVQTLGVHWCRNNIFWGHGTQNKHTEQLQPRSPPHHSLIILRGNQNSLHIARNSFQVKRTSQTALSSPCFS